MTSCNGWPTAERLITTTNIPRGLLGAMGARERDDSEYPTPPGGGVRIGGGSDVGKGRECSWKTKQALFYWLLCFYLVI